MAWRANTRSSPRERLRCFLELTDLNQMSFRISVLVILCLHSKGMLCNDEITIVPYNIAYVVEFSSVTLQTSYLGRNVVGRIVWKIQYPNLTNILEVPLKVNQTEKQPCRPGFVGNEHLFEYSCNSSNHFSITYLNITREKHGKILKCELWYSGGQAENETNLFVIVPTSFVNFSDPAEKTATVTENEDEKFSCLTSEERPISRIHWYITNKEESIGTGEITPRTNDSLISTVSTLRYKFNRNDTGNELYCTASNTDSESPKKSNRKLINVLYGTDHGPQIVNFTNGTVFSAVVHTQQSLTCYVTGGNPSPALTWNCFSGNTTNVSTKNEVRSNIRWTPSYRNTTLFCKCTSTQVVSGIQNFILNVEVLYPPSYPVFFVGEEPLLNGTFKVLNSSSAMIKCSSSSNPRPDYEWSRTTLTKSNSQNLTFLNIQLSDQGMYTCTANNTMEPSLGRWEHGRNSSSFILRVLYPPIIERFQEQFIEENQSLYIPCEAKSDPLPSRYTWTRMKNNIFLQNSSNLILMQTRREDTDTYICTAYNTMQPTGYEEILHGASEGHVNVTILYHPDVTVSMANETDINEGDVNVFLICSANGEPQKYSFANWTHYAPDGYTRIQEYPSSVVDHGKAYLMFSNTSYMDSGTYVCAVSNGIANYSTGEEFAKRSIKQTVKGRPVIIKMAPVIASARHVEATLWLTYYSNDAANTTVRWFKIHNGSRLPCSSQKDDRVFFNTSATEVWVPFYAVKVLLPGNKTELLIQNVTKDDYADYEIEISNTIKTVKSEIQFEPQGVPDSPSSFQIIPESITSSSIMLTWISGFSGGADQTFLIQYNASATAWINKTVNDSRPQGSEFNITIRQLSSETQYFFRIFAANKFGFSVNPQFLSARTTSDVSGAKKQEENDITGQAVGSAIGGAVVISGVIVVIIFIRRKKQEGKSAGAQKKSLLLGNTRYPDARDQDNTAEINLNPMYESSEAVQLPPGNADVYATVNKPSYSSNPGSSLDVYSVVNKARGKDMKSRKDKKGKKEDGRKKPTTSKQDDGILYENGETTTNKVRGADNVYENPVCSSVDEKPSRRKNDDGLIYVEVELPQQKDAQNKQPVIHGEDRTIYADVAFGRVGEPLPETDEEEK